MELEYWKNRSGFMEDLIYGCGGDIADRCGEYITFNPEPKSVMSEENSNAVVDEAVPYVIEYGNRLFSLSCKCSNISLKRHHLYCFNCGAKLNWKNIDGELNEKMYLLWDRN